MAPSATLDELAAGSVWRAHKLNSFKHRVRVSWCAARAAVLTRGPGARAGHRGRPGCAGRAALRAGAHRGAGGAQSAASRRNSAAPLVGRRRVRRRASGRGKRRGCVLLRPLRACGRGVFRRPLTAARVQAWRSCRVRSYVTPTTPSRKPFGCLPARRVPALPGLPCRRSADGGSRRRHTTPTAPLSRCSSPIWSAPPKTQERRSG